MSLHIQNLEYRLGVFTLGPIHLQMEEGEYLGILGPSGSGKTTLLRNIAGLCRPEKGRIDLGPKKVLHDGSFSLSPEKRKIGMLFQNLALWPHLTCKEHLELVFKYQGRSPAERSQKAEELLAKVALADRIDRKPSELSGGESQRLALARALASQPEILLLDEPFVQLDPHLKIGIIDEVKSLHQELKIPAIHITHDPVEIAPIAHRILLLRAGRIEQIGTMKELLLTPATPFVAQFFKPFLFLSRQMDQWKNEAS